MQLPIQGTRKVILLFMVMLLAFSGSTKEEKGKESTTSPDNNVVSNDPDEIDFLAYAQSIQGTWVNKKFLESIVKYKSPYKTQGEDPYFMVSIEAEKMKDDVVCIYGYEYGQTESAYMQCYKLDGQELKIHQIIDPEGKVVDRDEGPYYKKINLIIDQQDTILRIVTKENKTIDLKRIENLCADDQFDCGISLFINSKLLAGNYQLLDSSKTVIAKTITIDKYGKVSGYSKFRRAVLWNFFREGNHIFEHDVLALVPSQDKSERHGFYNDDTKNLFKFEYSKDAIQLKSIRINPEDNSETIGKTMYYLIRK